MCVSTLCLFALSRRGDAASFTYWGVDFSHKARTVWDMAEIFFEIFAERWLVLGFSYGSGFIITETKGDVHTVPHVGVVLTNLTNSLSE